MKVGITGQSGFVGTNLAHIVAKEESLELVQFQDSYFNSPDMLKKFVRGCDAIVHLAGVTRHPDPIYLYETNLLLCKQLISAMVSEDVHPHVLFASSVFEFTNTPYGKAKVAGRRLFEDWAVEHCGHLTGCIFPNVYGPGSKPFYCSFVANFAYQVSHGMPVTIQIDRPVSLIYVENLSKWIVEHLSGNGIQRLVVKPDFTMNVTEVAALFQRFASEGNIPEDHKNDLNVANLYSTYKYFLALTTRD